MDPTCVKFAADALTLLRAVYAPQAPDWLAELPAVEVLRRVLVQNYHIRTDTRGREVITRRDADTDGLPPGALRISSPYDTDTRWAANDQITHRARRRADHTPAG